MNVPEIFGTMVFNEAVMKERLPEETYKALKRTIQRGETLDSSLANTIAEAMRDWAIERGATHYTHWFQPMTGITAEKHDSFIQPAKNGSIVMEFSGKELIKGESDASSFPNGGLRSTFEARGYTAWDPTSYAFIKDDTLCIPTVFCSYGGHVLDKKTPLLRSMEAVNKQAMRLLKLFDTKARRVITTVGAEQEYFLVDKNLFRKRKDLIYCGRTLYGAKPPKGQELEDHYYGAIKPRVASYMRELDAELWKLGVLVKTEHNEVAPGQHELAPIFTNANLATDHNQLTMEIMKKVADKHDFVCLLHEKPFAQVNGSGKHNNWSMCTDSGLNLLEPGCSPKDNAQFLLFLSAVIRAVDIYQDILRVSVSSAGNDHRLGANEAPPSIISIFLGDELTEILNSIANGHEYKEKRLDDFEIGVESLPHFPKDTTDRNRTSPFAFTGNKFEFRMLGSSASISCTNTIINTIVSESMDYFATKLEQSDNFTDALNVLIKENYKEHSRIIFNGNNYSKEWKEEAKARGLSNFSSSAMAYTSYSSDKSVNLFAKYKIFTKQEIISRMEILQENYSRVITIEALTMVDIANKQIAPSVSSYCSKLSATALNKKQLGVNCEAELSVLNKLSALNAQFLVAIEELNNLITKSKAVSGITEHTYFCNDYIIPAMEKAREYADEMELYTAKDCWAFPTYGDLMYNI